MRQNTLHHVIDFRIIRDFTLCLEFDDEQEKVIDFRPILLGRLFGVLRDRTLFNQVQLNQELGTIVWPNGADIDPSVLHDWEQHVDEIVRRRRERAARENTAVVH